MNTIKHDIFIGEHGCINAEIRGVIDFQIGLNPLDGEVFDDALKCVVCDHNGDELKTMVLGDGIERVTSDFIAEQAALDEPIVVDPEAILFVFDYETFGGSDSISGEFTGVEIGRNEVDFNIKWKGSKL